MKYLDQPIDFLWKEFRSWVFLRKINVPSVNFLFSKLLNLLINQPKDVLFSKVENLLLFEAGYCISVLKLMKKIPVNWQFFNW